MELFTVSSEERENIFRYFGVIEPQLKEYTEIIKTWNAKQPHIPEKLSDKFIASVLLRNKFRVERTKEKLDKYFSLRGENRELLRGLENIVPSKHFSTSLCMPKLTPSLERVLIIKFLNADPEVYDVQEIVRLQLATVELHTHYCDMYVGVRLLIDWKNFSLKHLLKTNPILLTKNVSFLEKAYSTRIMGVECINFPEFTLRLQELLKLIFKSKIYERLHIHKNLQSLHEKIPRECLPSEYGGICGSIPDLLGKLEHLRPPDLKTNHGQFGLDGTFQKLNID